MLVTTPPPDTFTATREALRSLACYVISPARKARTGRIGLRSTGGGFGTPPFDDGSRIVVRGDELRVEPRASAPITTLRAAGAFVGVDLSPYPGVGHDLPPYSPDDELAVDPSASRWLGAWYAFAAEQLQRIGEMTPAGATVGEAQLWPEHFDLAVTVTIGDETVNVGFSPGDSYSAAPYVYVGPHDRAGLDGSYWNAPFGAVLTQPELPQPELGDDLDGRTAAFIGEGLRAVDARRATGSR